MPHSGVNNSGCSSYKSHDQSSLTSISEVKSKTCSSTWEQPAIHTKSSRWRALHVRKTDPPLSQYTNDDVALRFDPAIEKLACKMTSVRTYDNAGDLTLGARAYEPLDVWTGTAAKEPNYGAHRLTWFQDMTKNRWRYFRWTPRAAFIVFMYVGFVPGVLTYAFAKTDVSAKSRCWDWGTAHANMWLLAG